MTCDPLIASAGEGAAKMSQGLSTVLSVQDRSTSSYNHLTGTKGLGPTNDQETSLGMLLHSTLALRPDGRPIGLLHQKIWCRKEEERGSAKKRRELPIEKKESFKWLDGILRARERLNAQVPQDRRPRLIHIMDREGDIHEVLQTVAERSDGLIVRFDRWTSYPTRTATPVDDPSR